MKLIELKLSETDFEKDTHTSTVNIKEEIPLSCCCTVCAWLTSHWYEK